MEFKVGTNKKQWNTFLQSFDDYTFLQTWEWGEINSGKEKVIRWLVMDKKKLLGMVTAFTITARRGRMLFVPHGPLTKSVEVEKKILQKLITSARKLGCVCLRVSPWELLSESGTSKYKKLGFVKSGVIMHAEDTWLVDTTGSEEEVLGRMRKTTRNLIRRGMRENIKIWQSDDIADVDHLYDLQMEVVKRNNFVPFSKEYLKKELEILTKDNMAKLFLGKGDDGVVGAALIVFVGKYAYYYQSGSRESKQPVNYLLQWEVIREAKKRGCEVYNMWGIAPDDNPNHPWRGLTIFKTGFGGEMKRYSHSWDYPINFFGYWKLKLMEKIPKTWRSKLTNH